jgi:uncharacterized protein
MDHCREFVDVSGEVAVRGFLHSPTDGGADALILTHGAGANCNSALLVTLAEAFCASGLMVLRCDLPFRQMRPHGPPQRGSAERDREGLRRAVALMRRQAPGRVFLGGHSYGGRQATMLAAEQPDLVEELLLLSYPLHPPLKREQMRTEHFPRLQTAALFFSGTRDGFGSIGEMEAALKLIPARTELVAIEGAGHELMTKRNRDAVTRTVVEAFCAFANDGNDLWGKASEAP